MGVDIGAAAVASGTLRRVLLCNVTLHVSMPAFTSNELDLVVGLLGPCNQVVAVEYVVEAKSSLVDVPRDTEKLLAALSYLAQQPTAIPASQQRQRFTFAPGAFHAFATLPGWADHTIYITRPGAVGPSRKLLYQLFELMMADEGLAGLDDDAYDSSKLYELALGMYQGAQGQARVVAELARRGHVWLVGKRPVASQQIGS